MRFAWLLCVPRGIPVVHWLNDVVLPTLKNVCGIRTVCVVAPNDFGDESLRAVTRRWSVVRHRTDRFRLVTSMGGLNPQGELLRGLPRGADVLVAVQLGVRGEGR